MKTATIETRAGPSGKKLAMLPPWVACAEALAPGIVGKLVLLTAGSAMPSELLVEALVLWWDESAVGIDGAEVGL